MPASAASSSQLLDSTSGSLDLEVGVLLGAQRLDEVDLGLERDAAVADVVADQRGVLEALRPDSGDHRGPAWQPARGRASSGSWTSPSGSLSDVALELAGMKFIDGRADEAGDEEIRGWS